MPVDLHSADRFMEVLNELMLKTIPVVIMTVSPLQEDRVRSEALNVAGYLTKPIDVEKFVRLVPKLKDYGDGDMILPQAGQDERMS